MKKTCSKLQLGRETLHNLDATTSVKAKGGTEFGSYYCSAYAWCIPEPIYT